MIQIENTYFELGQSSLRDCLIICDRGVMDASACKYYQLLTNLVYLTSARHYVYSRIYIYICIYYIRLHSFNADISKEKWEKMMSANNWNPIELRDNRYHQILHLVSAANGAEDFYTTEVM